MVQLLQDLPASVVIFLLVAIGYFLYALMQTGIWFFQQWWVDRKERMQNQTDALLENTMAIKKLEIQIEHLNEYLYQIPKLQADVNFAHQKIRDLENSD